MENLKKEDFRGKEIERIREEYRRREKVFSHTRYQSSGGKYLYQDRKERVARLLRENGLIPLSDKKVLEVGCGIGVWLHDFADWGAQEKNLTGIELDAKKAEILKKRMPLSDIRVGDAFELPWAGQSFDLVVQSTLFTSLLDSEYKKNIASEMTRVLKPAGAILWYDFRYNNPFNANVKAIELPEIQALYPDFNFLVKKITLAPPLARFFAPWAKGVCELLSKISFLNTHYLILMRKR